MHNDLQVVVLPVTVLPEAVLIAFSPAVKAAADIESPAFTHETLELNLDIGNSK